MKKHVISLFDYTGIALKPWAKSGYEVWAVDIAHKEFHSDDGWHDIQFDLSAPWLPPINRDEIAFVFAFPPCDHLAVSGGRWFRGKGLRKLSESIALFATAAEFCEWSGAPYLIENPVSTISTYWRKPDYTFSPEQYTGFCKKDNYTKKTCLWTGGGFVMPPENRDLSLGEPDNRIHACPPSADRKMIRSATPYGFAKAVFEANKEVIA